MIRRMPLSDADVIADLGDTLRMTAGIIAGVASQHRAALIASGLPSQIADMLVYHAVSCMQQQLFGGGR